MATISELRSKFDEMPIEQKKQFIQSMKKKLEGSNSPSQKQFLSECIQKYNEQARGGEQQRPGAGGMGRPAPYGGANYQQRQIPGHYAPGSVVERLHVFFGSTLFLVGIILITAGTLISAVISFSVFSIFSLLLTALPIVSAWLKYAASKSPKQPEKFLAAITLDKVSAIITLVGLSLLAFLMLVLAFFMASLTGEPGVILVMLIPIAVLMAWTIIVFIAFMKVLKGLREGIERNSDKQLSGIMVYSIMRCVEVGLTALSSIISAVAIGVLLEMVSEILDELLAFLPSEFSGFLSFEGIGITILLSALLTLVVSVGQIITIVVLNQYNGSLKRPQYRR